MAMTKEEFLKELNMDLALEYAAAIQYIQHASVMTGSKYTDIMKELIIHADEEMNHAKMLNEQIDYLGGVPTTDVEKRETSEKALEMLQQDLRGEQTAISRYKERIGQAEQLQLYGTRRILEDILMDEEEHERDLQDVLNEA